MNFFDILALIFLSLFTFGMATFTLGAVIEMVLDHRQETRRTRSLRQAEGQDLFRREADILNALVLSLGRQRRNSVDTLPVYAPPPPPYSDAEPVVLCSSPEPYTPTDIERALGASEGANPFRDPSPSHSSTDSFVSVTVGEPSRPAPALISSGSRPAASQGGAIQDSAHESVATTAPASVSTGTVLPSEIPMSYPPPAYGGSHQLGARPRRDWYGRSWGSLWYR